MSTEIKGYRELSDTEVDTINQIKDLEILVGQLWRNVSGDHRWRAIAKTHFQEGFTAFVRSVAKPVDVF